ncbi:phage tail tape measure protein [Rhizobium cremeum]|uniref:phage tail tape measure protein n=1 Tax=Rhizobium cremeum TaxID=2813827 RepID=UPI001FD3894F|nr:phage tail tape measure protein [Rhizobium cremeum]MCJ7996692.1 phage tail tape measure protein [Rhizobium cremeum]MCJ7999416.1 phage tail tape measure protein [Rhizobium cremeum]
MNRVITAALQISAIDKTGRVFKNIADKMGDVNRRAGEFNRRQGMLARGTADMYAMVARYAAPAALAYGAKAAVTDFAALERQMTRIGITADATSEQTSRAFAEALKVSKDLNYDSVAPAIEALDTLVSSGKSLEEAMAFLPSVLATAQASGAATADIANTGLKAADALEIETSQLQRAFDIMVMGGKAGQFELKDMAQYIPGLANSFATLGYQGEDGLKRLVAILQTIREDTGDASSAATQAQNIFGKMFSEETANKFKKFGVDLRSEMQAAAKSGEDAVSAFVRLSKEAIKGDLSKLPLLFSDQEFRLGMQSLITSEDSLRKFLELMNSAEVDGAVWRDVNRVMSDTQASIDRMSNSWDRLWTNFGKAAAPTAIGLMDSVSSNLDYHASVNAGLEKRGMDWWDRTRWGLTSTDDEKMQAAIEGGYSDRKAIADYRRRQYESGKVKASTGRPGSRDGRRINQPASREKGKRRNGSSIPDRAPIPSPRPLPETNVGNYPSQGSYNYVPDDGGRAAAMDEFINGPDRLMQGFMDATSEASMKIVDSGKEAGQKVAEGGQEGAGFFSAAADAIRAAGMDAARAIQQAVEQAKRNAGSSRAGASVGKLVNADTGPSMPPQKPGGGPW